ncbi:hypothetical protein PISMIDRAFT_22062 [Pisolithus microcarpus 441]|uniref:Uncharacterized protein n=1 Tax=Pisolithus microcarpus 441 TaxID=765257 RepID=A0A0D0A6V5_9AGAM|nr:hypothetical protein BKA83DRAFT_22062 [Pisolithus microcarpus]KIK27793.1 hypothetical protein PISMIDRAFT_22062 [Pisolithus microcarpus 441]
MSSCPKPRPKLSITHIHCVLLGLSAFIVLCGIKTLHIMNMQALKRTHAHWVYQQLKKTWRAISAYNSHSGCSFHATCGADVQSQAEQEAWDAFMVTESSESREMSQFQNKGWLFFEKMAELCPSGSGATGAYSFMLSEAMSINLGISGDFDDLYADSSMMPEVAYLELDLDSLLQLRGNIISTNPAMQSCAIENTFSLLNDVTKGKSKGQTSARSKASSLSATAAANRQSKLSQAEPSVVPALTGMTSTILRAADTMTEIKDLLVTAPTAPPAEAPTASSTSPEIFNNITHYTSRILMADTALSADIWAELALAFLSNPTLCQMYANLTNPVVQHHFTWTWFQKNCSTESAEGLSGSDARLAGTGGDWFPVYQDDQSNFM